jgi:probable HAF family extracellular repeat protein
MKTKQSYIFLSAKNMLAAALLGLVMSVPGLANAEYNFTTIDPPGSIETFANANSTNAIAGEYVDVSNKRHGFLLRNNIYTAFDVPGADYTQVNGINANGSITGTYRDVTPTPPHLGVHAFFLNNGVLTTLDPPESIRTQGGFINAQGQAVGAYRSGDQKRHGFIWKKGKYSSFNVPDDDPVLGTVPFGINDLGQIVGSYVDAIDGFRHGFLLSKGVYTSLDVPGAANFTVAEGINNAGQIVGFFLDADFNRHGFVLSDGVYTTIDVPDAIETGVFSINAQGKIVGFYVDVDGVTHGYVGTPTH